MALSILVPLVPPNPLVDGALMSMSPAVEVLERVLMMELVLIGIGSEVPAPRQILAALIRPIVHIVPHRAPVDIRDTLRITREEQLNGFAKLEPTVDPTLINSGADYFLGIGTKRIVLAMDTTIVFRVLYTLLVDGVTMPWD